MKKTLAGVILLLALSSLAGGCGKEAENLVEAPAENPEEESVEEELPEVQAWEEEQGFSFADVADREFYFSSGVGGWYTVLCIHEDGSFDGYFRDSNMGETGEGYPNGTLYYSEFTGSFTEPEKVDDWSYRFQIEEIEYPLGFGEEIKDGILYCYATAYGLDGAEDLYLYLPGTELAGLPGGYRSWVGYYNLNDVQETVLPFYGLYNEAMEEGFSSYPAEESWLTEPEEPSGEEALEWSRQIREKVLAAQEEADRLEAEGQNALSQADMNGLSGEIYRVWDDALNEIWGILTEHMDPEEMERLTEEERIWIRGKEAAVQEAGADVEGGTLYPLVTNGKAADLTRKRVYELASLAGAPLDTQLIYEGCYFDSGVYPYWVGDVPIEPDTTYCEIWISNVTDTSFEFAIDEIVMETEERTELLPSGTAEIRDNGRTAVYKDENMTLTFSFPSEPHSFPKDLTVTGMDKLEGNTYMNKDIPGHESG